MQLVGNDRPGLPAVITFPFVVLLANGSLWVDAKILVRAAGHVFGRRGR